MTGCLFDPPSPFVAEWIRKLSNDLPGRRRALDVAMGRGRHALPLAALGFDVYGVDIAFEAIADACARGRARGLAVRAWCADLTISRLPAGRFELIVVTRYLQRNLCAGLVEALTPGGVLLYETFTEHQRGRGRGPQSPDHLLNVGELRSLFAELDQLCYEELTDPADDALARLAARKRSNPS